MFLAVQRAGEGDPRSMTHQALTRSVRPDTEKMRLPLAWRVPRTLCCTLCRPAMPTPPRTWGPLGHCAGHVCAQSAQSRGAAGETDPHPHLADPWSLKWEYGWGSGVAGPGSQRAVGSVHCRPAPPAGWQILVPVIFAVMLPWVRLPRDSADGEPLNVRVAQVLPFSRAPGPLVPAGRPSSSCEQTCFPQFSLRVFMLSIRHLTLGAFGFLFIDIYLFF